MEESESAFAYVGRTWIVVTAASVILGLGTLAALFAVVQGVVSGLAYGVVVAVAAVLAAALLYGYRARLTATADGLVVAAPFGRRTVPWAAISDVDLTFDGSFVVCRDEERRICLVMASSAWYPRSSQRRRDDNEALVYMLRFALADDAGW
ncbi:PH domain-containing protein [Nocardioides sp. NPDC059952]|uniref:PH domain-containing protein n=1 Tax=Nocardioides sp. NPDC059952 TaxID=3347014 RepID=UPI00364B2432